jgi:hypothetical protein
MPTISTLSANIPFQAGYKAGKTARQMYNEEKAREDARLKAQEDLQREQLNFTKQKAEYDHLEMLTKLAQEKVKGETELMLKSQEANQKISMKAHENAIAQGLLPKTSQYDDFVIKNINAMKTDFSSYNTASDNMQPQGQGQPPTPHVVTDEETSKTSEYDTPKTLKEKMNIRLQEETGKLREGQNKLQTEKVKDLDKIDSFTNSVAKGTLKVSQLGDSMLKRRVISNFDEKVAPENIKKYGEEGALIKNSAVYDAPLEEKTTTKLTQAQQVFEDFEELEQKLSEYNSSDSLQPLIGIIESKSPWATKSQELKARMKTLVTNMARGVYSEVGTFTDQDFKTYESVLPNIKNTDELNSLLMKMSKDKIAKSIKRTIVNAAKSQVDVNNYYDVYKTADNYLKGITEEQSTETDPEYEQMLKLASGGK